MMNYPKSVPVLFGEVVTRASANLNAAGQTLLQQLQEADAAIVRINYQYGPAVELTQTLTNMRLGKDVAKERFPLVWLIEDIPVDRRNAKRFFGDVSLRVVIAYPTKDTYTSAERETATFAPILRPIYYNLLECLPKHNAFSAVDEADIPHRMTERKFMGSDTQIQNMLTDFVDAIDIQDLSLTISFKHSYTPIIQQ